MRPRPPSPLPAAGRPLDRERELVEAARGGDASAFARLHDLHRAPVVRRLSFLLGPAGQVDDLAQETFLRAWRALPRLEDGALLRPWLLRIATRLALDEQRRARRSLWRLFVRPDELEEAGGGAAGGGEAGAELAAVHRALLRLSPRLRTVVVQFELEGQGLAEIAAEQGLPLHTVASRLRRGRDKLRAELARCGLAPDEEAERLAAAPTARGAGTARSNAPAERAGLPALVPASGARERP